MRERHWKAVQRITGRHFTISPYLRMETIFSLQLDLYAEQVYGVVEKAVKVRARVRVPACAPRVNGAAPPVLKRLWRSLCSLLLCLACLCSCRSRAYGRVRC